jgi:hypothetical protein
MRALESPKGSGPGSAYVLGSQELPFLLRFAQRRHVKDLPIPLAGATSSDGSTTSNDGSEEFDWLTDD